MIFQWTFKIQKDQGLFMFWKSVSKISKKVSCLMCMELLLTRSLSNLSFSGKEHDIPQLRNAHLWLVEYLIRLSQPPAAPFEGLSHVADEVWCYFCTHAWLQYYGDNSHQNKLFCNRHITKCIYYLLSVLCKTVYICHTESS